MDRASKKKISESDFSYVADFSRHGDINQYLGELVGPAFVEYRKRWDAAHSLDLETEFPLYLSLETLLKCNLKCTMCTYSDEKAIAAQAYSETMSDTLFDAVVKQATDYGCPSVGFNTLNEPLLDRKIINRISQASRGSFVDLRMNTNGSLLTEKRVERLLESGLTRLLVGFDAASPATYAKVRIQGNYDKLLRNVLRFLNLREKRGLKLPILRVSFVKMAINEAEIPEFHSYWRDIADVVSIQEYMPPVPDDAKFLEKHAETKLIPESYTCPQPYERLVIKGNGEVTPCCAQYNYKLRMGNISQNTIFEIWNSASMRALRRQMKEKTWHTNPVCNACLTSSYLY